MSTGLPPGCPSCGVVATRRKEWRPQRLRDIRVAGPVEVFWSRYRGFATSRRALVCRSLNPRPRSRGSPAPPAGSGKKQRTRLFADCGGPLRLGVMPPSWRRCSSG
ncbi:MAG: transposase family protein [Actinomycetota bacterium]